MAMKILAIPASRVGYYTLVIMDGDEPHIIGTLVPGIQRRAEQIKKDLALMTAAPDLLDALKTMRHRVAAYGMAVVMDAPKSVAVAMDLRTIDAAIAKATG